MPCLSAQFCNEPDTFSDNLTDRSEAYNYLFEHMAKIATGYITHDPVTQHYAMEACKAVTFFLKPPQPNG